MVTYIYCGNEDRKYIDVTGELFYLTKGCLFSSKVRPNWDTVEEHKEHKDRVLQRLEKSEQDEPLLKKKRKGE